uniref:Uncharacterized protein n=1 Tax=Chromera velia CCMP2878 TaxID=1169474 RepID=A0A0G4I606_9ALVE|eukprot:Cvel_11274.t1-p1 / transcript=Cvel_11274.t1 / gene=Cvel_11274 / organism=Chromera_velia_CCMP2878 / gene_product=227 kDa spindle- and centromere-associated protein, putative / transcript_product=227 kDa spindle- and centromere-associated protein, putative / location=Cvel_scaffold703:12575-30681(+) / protein_length=1478 / sequence_SO=supercontig / SO=protein_coding / is_pseudo=false
MPPAHGKEKELPTGEEVILWSSVFANKEAPFPRPDVFRSALRIRSLSCGETVAAFVTSDLRLYTMEWSAAHNLESCSPRLVDSLRSRPVASVACGGSHLACITNAGELYTMGRNDFGQLGSGRVGGGCRGGALGASPVKVGDLGEEFVVQVAASGASAALSRSGDVYVWGTQGWTSPVRLCGVPLSQISLSSCLISGLTDEGQVWLRSVAEDELGGGQGPGGDGGGEELSMAWDKQIVQVAVGGRRVMALASDAPSSVPPPDATTAAAAENNLQPQAQPRTNAARAGAGSPPLSPGRARVTVRARSPGREGQGETEVVTVVEVDEDGAGGGPGTATAAADERERLEGRLNYSKQRLESLQSPGQQRFSHGGLGGSGGLSPTRTDRSPPVGSILHNRQRESPGGRLVPGSPTRSGASGLNTGGALRGVQAEMERAEEQVRVSEERAERLEKEAAVLREARERAETMALEERRQFQQMKANADNEMQRTHSAEVETLSRDLQRLQRECEEVKRDRDALTQEKSLSARALRDRDELRKDLEDLRERAEGRERDLAAKERDLDAAHQQTTELRERVRQLQQQVESQDEAEGLRRRRENQKENEAARERRRADEAEAENRKLSLRATHQESELERLRAQVDDRDQEASELRERLRGVERESGSLRETLDRQKAEMRSQSDESRRLRQQAQDLQARAETLEDEKDRAIRQAESAKQATKEVESTISGLESSLREVQRSADAKVEALQVQADQQQEKTRADCALQMRHVREAADLAESRCAAAEDEIQRMQQEAEQNARAVNRLRQESVEKEKTAESLRSQIRQIQAQSDESVASKSREIAQLKAENSHLAEELAELRSCSQATESDLRAEISGLQSELREKTSALEEAGRREEADAAKLNSFDERVREMAATLDALTEAFNQKESECERLNEETKQRQKHVEALEQRLTEVSKEPRGIPTEKVEEKVRGLEESLRQKNDLIRDLEKASDTEHESLRARLSAVSRELEGCSEKLEDAEGQVKKLSTEVDSLSAQREELMILVNRLKYPPQQQQAKGQGALPNEREGRHRLSPSSRGGPFLSRSPRSTVAIPPPPPTSSSILVHQQANPSVTLKATLGAGGRERDGVAVGDSQYEFGGAGGEGVRKSPPLSVVSSHRGPGGAAGADTAAPLTPPRTSVSASLLSPGRAGNQNLTVSARIHEGGSDASASLGTPVPDRIHILNTPGAPSTAPQESLPAISRGGKLGTIPGAPSVPGPGGSTSWGAAGERGRLLSSQTGAHQYPPGGGTIGGRPAFSFRSEAHALREPSPPRSRVALASTTAASYDHAPSQYYGGGAPLRGRGKESETEGLERDEDGHRVSVRVVPGGSNSNGGDFDSTVAIGGGEVVGASQEQGEQQTRVRVSYSPSFSQGGGERAYGRGEQLLGDREGGWRGTSTLPAVLPGGSVGMSERERDRERPRILRGGSAHTSPPLGPMPGLHPPPSHDRL